MKAKKIYEVFTQHSDPIKDMRIGVNFDNLKVGAIIQPKRCMTFGRKTGRVVAFGKGRTVYLNYYYVVVYIHEFRSEKTFKVICYGEDLERALDAREDPKTYEWQSYYASQTVITLKKLAFENRFKIIMQGIKE